MGSLLVAKMVQEAVEDSSSRKVHPFFVIKPPLSDVAASPAQQPVVPSGIVTTGDGNAASREGEQSGPVQDRNSHVEPSMRHCGQKRKDRASTDGTLIGHFLRPAASASPKQEPNSGTDLQVRAQLTAPEPQANRRLTPGSLHNSADEGDVATGTAAKPKKTLKFNAKTGTLGSPPKPKKIPPLTKIVTVKYGSDDEAKARIGCKITAILEGKWQAPATPPKKRGRPPRKSKQSHETTDGGSSKTAIHPVVGLTAPQLKEEKQEELKKRKHSIFTSTPVSPRRTKRINNDAGQMPQFGFKVKGQKFPGSVHPLWPAKGMAHVRGDDQPRVVAYAMPGGVQGSKSKGQVTIVREEESILAQLTKDLDLESIKGSLYHDPDNFPPVPKQLRLPETHFESGRRLQRRIGPELSLCPPRSSGNAMDTDDTSASPGRPPPPPPPPPRHPAIKSLYRSLDSQLSAFDRSTCEGQTWAHKYAPATAAQVIQSGREAILLRDWLEALRVQSVDTGSTSSKPAEAPAKKRRRKRLDDFIVDSEEDENLLDELSDEEAQWAPDSSGQARTVVRGGGLQVKDRGRLPNAVVLSGPHGSGKSAAIYAAAKELGFEIFEINSSSRRSGKDLLEKVGDMTRNHLVQQHKANKATKDEISEDKTTTATTEDITSGKQGIMTAFFKLQPGNNDQKQPKTASKSKTQATAEKSVSTKNQKQSLILLEEVDVLYEEDKQFWATLMSMITQSRRPFVLTCNEESLVPLQSLNLYGIFRFSAPPLDTAVDLCLLIAANEGHALKRPNIESLYSSRGHDLRATITELNYWCQIGVGDRKGGFDWFVSRWPRGSDLDREGRVLRVISEDTYQHHMGWFSRDLVCSTSGLAIEEELLRQSQSLWGFEMGDWLDTLDVSSGVAGDESASSWAGRGEALSSLDDFCASMSDTDLFSDRTSTGLCEAVDPTLPDLPDKAREDYISGRGLLEASLVVQQASASAAMGTTARSLARDRLFKAAESFPSVVDSSRLMPIDEPRAAAILEKSFDRRTKHTTRHDISLAFDPIAATPASRNVASSYLDPSVFDCTLSTIVLDVAPWVRSILAFDHRLMTERKKLSSLLSEGGNGTRKRMRTTRSAYSALEGGERITTRRERYFGDSLVMGLVMRTGGDGWQDLLSRQEKDFMGGTQESLGSSPCSEGTVPRDDGTGAG